MPSIHGERDVVIDVTIKSDTRGAKEAAGELEHIDKAAGKSAKSLGEVDKAADKTGHSMRTAAGDQKLFREEVAKSTARIEELERTMLRTGDRSLRRQIASERSWLNALKKIPLQEGAKSPFEGVADQRLMGVPAPVLLGGLTALSAAGPAIGAMLAGLVGGAVGTAGLAAGLLSAAKSQTVQAAAHTFGQEIADEFFRGGAAFERPAIQAMHTIEQAFKDMHVPEALAKLAPTVDTIADGFADMGRNIMPGFNRALDRMGPFAEVAKEGLGDLGSSLGRFLDDITKSPGALAGLDAAFKLINGTVVFLGASIKFLADAFGGALQIGIKVTDLLRQIPGVGEAMWGKLNDLMKNMMEEANNAKPLKEQLGQVVTQVHNLGDAFVDTARANDIFNDAMDRAYGNALNFLDAQISVEEALDRFAEGIREHGKSLDVDTEAGRANLRALEDITRGASDAAKQKLIETGSVKDANAVYEFYRQKLYDTFIALNYTRAEAQRMADQWLALEKLKDITKTFTIRRYTLGAIPPNTFGGGFQEFAGGGVVQGPYGSPQLAIVHAGERVLTPQQQRMAMSGGGYGSDAVRPFVYSGGNRIVSVVIDEIRREVSKLGGDLAVLGLKL
jgi:hypothetical protein